jgi:hypothetical protein
MLVLFVLFVLLKGAQLINSDFVAAAGRRCWTWCMTW